MRRLRDKETGEVYGWNPNMAKLPQLEEFDDDEEYAEDFVPFSQREDANSEVSVEEVVVLVDEVKVAAEEGAPAADPTEYADDLYKDTPTEELTDPQFNTLSPEEQERRVKQWHVDHPNQDGDQVEETAEPEPQPKAKKKK